MNRLTWSGVALHAGQLPGYPASHGCVRLPLEFSAKLFGITEVGTPVIIANAATYPGVVAQPGMTLAANPRKEYDAIARAAKKNVIKTSAGRTPHQPVSSIIVSSADQKVLVLDDGVLVAEGGATIVDAPKPLGNHVFVLSNLNSKNRELNWRTIGYYNDPNRELEPTELVTLQRLRGDSVVVDQMRSRMRAGTILVTVDVSLTPDLRTTGKDFVIMATDDGSA